jgi:hypothetical protein
VAVKAFSQTTDGLVVEEKSSDWIKITSTVVTPKKRQSNTVKKRTPSKAPSIRKENSNREFEKTNQQVNRFKKKKG